MTLKYQTESLDGVPEAVHDLYEKSDNGYTLKVEGVVPEAKFKEANQRAVDAAEEARRRRSTVERVTGKLGLDSADGLDEALEELLGKAKAPKGGGEDQEKIVAQIKAQYEGKIADQDKRFQSAMLDAASEKTKSALQEAGFPAAVAEMLAKTSKDRLTIDDAGKVRIMSGDGNPLAGSGSDGYATYGDLAKELAAAMPELLMDKGKGGGGKPPASGTGNGGAKTVTRSQFDAMSHAERAGFSKTGGKVVDG